MRITTVNRTLDVHGGIESRLSRMLNYWVATGHQVTAITYEDMIESDFFHLDSRVKRIRLGFALRWANTRSRMANNPITRFFYSVRALRSAIRASQPEVIVALQNKTSCFVLLAAIGFRIPVIAMETTDPRMDKLNRPMWYWLRRLLYPRAAAAVVQTDSVKNWAQSFLSTGKVHVIPNPVERPNHISSYAVSPRAEKPMEVKDTHVVCGLGRLAIEKGFDLLIRAFSQCAADFPDWSLVIYGEGEERERLKGLVSELGLADRVRLPGLTHDPEQALSQADIFAFSSRFEGFPNALLEAMAVGLPVISFNCPSGPGEIIRDGVDGILVPPDDVEGLAKAMRRLMGDEEERKKLGLQATEICERYGIEKVMWMWDQLIRQVTDQLFNQTVVHVIEDETKSAKNAH